MTKYYIAKGHSVYSTSAENPNVAEAFICKCNASDMARLVAKDLNFAKNFGHLCHDDLPANQSKNEVAA